MISLFLNVVFCAVSFLPAYFDHGERWKAFKAAKGWDAFVPGLKFFLINWGLPFLAFSIIIVSAFENHGKDEELKQLRTQVSQTSTNLANLDPSKQFANTVTASAWIECNTDLEAKWSNLNLDGDLEKEDFLGGIINLNLIEKSGNIGLRLVAVKRTKIPGTFYIEFGRSLPERSHPESPIGTLILAGDLDKFANVMIGLGFLPEDTAIARGGVIVRVNSMERRYTIPSQKTSTPFRFVLGNVITNELPTHPIH